MLKILKQFKWFLKDYWWRKDNILSWVVLIVLVALGFGVVEINVRINEWSKSFYDTLEAFQADKLYVLIQEYLVYVAVFVVAAVYRGWLRKLLIIRWRSHLTERLLGDWLEKRAFYRIALKQITDNPDQRIAEDVNIFVSRTIELFISLLTNLAQLYSFIAILWKLSGTHTFNIMGHDITVTGYLVWIAVVYALFGSIFTQVIGKKLHELNYRQQKFEADFRASLVRKNDNAEQIALYHGESRERATLRGEFNEIIGNWRLLMNRERNLGFFTTAYDRFSLMLPVLASIPLFMAKAITLGGLMQIRSAFGAVFNSLSWFVFAYTILPEWSATVQRLHQFRENILTEQDNDKPAPLSDGLEINGLNIYTPNGEAILSNVRAKISPQKWTQLAGRSGLGKSTLLRTIGGLWADYDGAWQAPKGTSLLLPQRTYLGSGTLAEILSYPDTHIHDDRVYHELLAEVGLEKWQHDLHKAQNWAQTLSAGEQQRIAIARALLIQPDYLYLDENTSALDMQSARYLLNLLKEKLPHTTVVIVSHQPELADMYDEVLDLSAFKAA
ncbi:ABC transporter ATP-binding protein/permease [Bergeriella denitrificans]|uniref:ABC transporter ATP-binding protein n=1 Tax=Bergeriella denitrificans TaxID=494 RepID=A0A378UJ60_BERDE|nr:ABC transporter ATP-binding protein/permease [Bergeriella denitrificans]STZ76719.1 ABC transporter ATP-binding protein [Bergeriella denitrificans]